MLENLSWIEPAQVNLWDMKIRAAARVLERGVQDDLIQKV